MPRLPNFLIAGAPKSGTTSLYHYLDQHPGIYMSAIKEPHYFAAEIREENCDPGLRCRIARERNRCSGIVAEWDEYLRLFENATDETALGEASVCYLWSPTAPARIAERIPDARILVILRNPVDRAFSQYLHGLGSGVIEWSFREHIRRNLRHRSGQFCAHYPFLEFGLYSKQVARYLDRFGRNVRVGYYEDWRDRPMEVFRDICRFLNVSPKFSPDMSRRHLTPQIPRSGAIGWLKRSGWWQAAARVTPARLRPLIRGSLIRRPGTTRMDAADRRYVLDFYREDIRKLAGLVGCDLDGWLRAD